MTLFSWLMLQRAHRYVRTALYRHLHCAWCWRALRIIRWYPPRWSSTMCSYHKQQTRARQA
ncbi:MAG: hypothetical protein ACYDER_07695, partial [Ktedonobacteraceae bacterium]